MKKRSRLLFSAGVAVVVLAVIFAVIFELIQTRSENAGMLSWPGGEDGVGTPASFVAAWAGVIFACVVAFLLVKKIFLAMFERFRDPLYWQGED